MPQQKIGQAGLWMAGWLSATLAMTIVGRELAHSVSVFEMMMFRSLIATLILTPIIFLNGGLTGRLSQLRLHAARNVLHYAGQYAWFSALLLIPLVEVIAIEFTMPLWIAILASAFLAESVAIRQAARLRLASLLIRLGLAHRASEVLEVASAAPATQ